MIRRILAPFLCIAAATGSVAHAQGCESVIALSRVMQTTVSDQSVVSQHAANFCNEYSSNKRSGKTTNIGASYKFLAASFGRSNVAAEEVASRYCSASNDSSASNDAYRQYVEAIAPGAFTAYETCLRVAKEDLRYNVDVNSVLPKQLLITASFTSSSASMTKTSVAYSASEGVTCKWNGVEGPTRDIQTGSTAFLNCSRSQATLPSSITLIRQDSGTQNPLTLKWQAYDPASGLPVDVLKTLQTRLDALQQEKLDRTEWPDGTYVLLRGNGQCPAGFTQKDVYLRAVDQFVPPNGNYSEYVKADQFGASRISCHGSCGQYKPHIGEINISACVK